MKYLNLFETESTYNSYISESKNLPNVSYVIDIEKVFYNPFTDITSLYEFVDLGLPSGTLWATCNVGATKPEEYGLYFAWGETEGYTESTDTKNFSWNDYKFTTDGGTTFTKYNETDGKLVLELEDDAAHASDNTCRMPTKADFEELTSYTTSTWETLNGVNGSRFTSTTNGNSIFIPAAGGCSNGSVVNVGSNGGLWSSSLYEDESFFSKRSVGLGFDSDFVDVGPNNRYDGCTVRPVKSNN